MSQLPENKHSLTGLVRDERGLLAVIVTIWLPVIVGFLTLATDMANYYYTRNMLQVTAEVAALAASSRLPVDTGCSVTLPVTPTSPCDVAISFARQNMPQNLYGDVVNNTNSGSNRGVTLGKWTDGCLVGGGQDGTCFAPLPGGTTCLTFICNAVRVTTQFSAANGNSSKFRQVFTPLLGLTSYEIGATAIAVYGQGNTISNQPTYNVILVQDITGSLSQPSLTGMKVANRALLECLHNNAGKDSTFGITLFTGCSGAGCGGGLQTYRLAENVVTNSTYTDLKTMIGDPPTTTNKGIMKCGNTNTNTPPTPMPPCSNPFNNATTSQESGINSALVQMCPGYPTCNPPPGPSGSKNIMIVVSDGLPEAPGCGNGTSEPPCNGQNGFPDLQGQATTAANNAAAAGIDVFTIFFGSTQTGIDFMKSLARKGADPNTGTPWAADPTKAMTSPTVSDINKYMAQICAAQSHRLVW